MLDYAIAKALLPIRIFSNTIQILTFKIFHYPDTGTLCLVPKLCEPRMQRCRSD